MTSNQQRVAELRAATDSRSRCAAKIWPSYSDRWMQCPGVVEHGRCTAYGTLHDTANAERTR